MLFLQVLSSLTDGTYDSDSVNTNLTHKNLRFLVGNNSCFLELSLCQVFSLVPSLRRLGHIEFLLVHFGSVFSFVPGDTWVLVSFLEIKLKSIVFFEQIKQSFVSSELDTSEMIVVPVLLGHFLDISS